MADALKTINPTNGKEIQSYPLMTDAQYNDAIEACHAAFEDWRHVPAKDRAATIKKIGEALRNNADKLANLMTEEMGKLLSQSYQEVELCAAICDWTAQNGPDELASEERDLGDTGTGHIVYSPIGVIYGIQPWNYPAYQVIRYSIANLMAGNGVLLKHAESVTGTGQLLGEIYREAGLPEHLFTVLTISHDQSDKVIEHDLVRGVTLTGSPAAGEHVGGRAAKALKKTVLELGSNDAYIVLEDADLEQAVPACVKGRIYNNGETCIAAKRFVVVNAVYDKFRDAFVKAMKDLTLGDPTSEDADLGPMARKDLREDLHEQVTKSIANGAKVLCGGEMPEGEGYYYPATVLENVTSGQPAYDDELFGPVAALIRAKDQEDAMRIANDSRFGLGGAIFSQDVEKAKDLAAAHFDTGMVFINDFGLANPKMPFGGVKRSGYGREHGGFGMKEFVNVKGITVAG
ncbi:NAD-dependent succinate-semialdehyde dehydrogenase [Litoreibacter arenae]|uniref:Succinate-semialdehyde dehydrogenase (NAD, NADP+) n=1 Tax=Litoreibacter arenae DSM 19593 TaxID=1123360 RepID=S9QC21_9RHOB|nr:NAD-dependent succinate-semialdehyde dehydrogenase [Litoreibacter arenae]EPX77118.1 Succinate-semialdehyde dehydrogenase (NAD, NADP+) [Litoreibacter arenae DSM 19593]